MGTMFCTSSKPRTEALQALAGGGDAAGGACASAAGTTGQPFSSGTSDPTEPGSLDWARQNANSGRAQALLQRTLILDGCTGLANQCLHNRLQGQVVGCLRHQNAMYEPPSTATLRDYCELRQRASGFSTLSTASSNKLGV